MDLLLTHGYFLREDPKELAVMKPYVPLGILYLSSHLKRKGFEVEIFDTTFRARADLLAILETGPPSVVGIYGNLMTRRTVLELTACARGAGWTVVLGGPEPSTYAREYLEAGAHVIVQGEGEITLEELLPALRAGSAGALERVNGIIFRRADGSIAHTPPRTLIAELDSLPWPDRERVDIEDYIKVWKDHHGLGSVSVITARGCPYHCRWCSHSTYGMTHRRRSAGCVVDEVEWIVQRYQPDMLWIADDVFTIHHGWIYQYAEEMKRRNLRIAFECITRADRVNSRIADTLAELGCFRVWVGSESGSQRILDAMERGVTVEEVRQSIQLLRARGIQTGMFLMWGYEGEDIADIEATVTHVKSSMPDVFLTTVSYPIRGTPYYEEVESRLVNLAEWSRTTDRDFKLRGRHSRRFFGFADQLLKNEVGLHKLLISPEASPDAATVAYFRKRIDEARQGLQQAYEEVEA
jgi:anaerobic magnesium-protoporphyrin IX monomethyl ester cyclase